VKGFTTEDTEGTEKLRESQKAHSAVKFMVLYACGAILLCSLCAFSSNSVSSVVPRFTSYPYSALIARSM